MPISRNSWKDSRVSKLLGIRYPIIQGPFGGLNSIQLAADVSNAGGMGSYGAQPLSPTDIVRTVAAIRSQTGDPFAINLWVSTYDTEAQSISQKRIDEAVSSIHHYFQGLNLPLPQAPTFVLQDFAAQADALLEARPPVASFVFGVPDKGLLDACRRQNILTIGTATTPDEAMVLEEAGLDLVVASSFEAGGHRGSFLAPAEVSLTGMISLLPQVVDRVAVPVIAAGGIADGRGIAAAFALGAEAVQIGTAFLPCSGSGINPTHRKALLSEAANATGLTKAFTGRLARGIRNRLFEEFDNTCFEALPYPVQRHLLSPYMQAAIEAERVDLLSMWAGQSAPLIEHIEVVPLMQSLIEQTDRVFQSFSL